MNTKVCIGCGKEKPLDCFSKYKRSKDGRKARCKECIAAELAAYMAEHGDEVRTRKHETYELRKAKKEERTAKAVSAGVKRCTACGLIKPVTEFREKSDGGLDGKCRECMAAYDKWRRDKDPEAYRARRRASYQRNKDARIAHQRQYYREHSDEGILRAKNWRLANPERYEHLMVLGQERRRARKRLAPSDFSARDWEECKAFFADSDGFHCAYCGKVMQRLTQDHVVPVYNGGGYTRDNIIPACQSCNSRKNRAEIWEWYRAQPFYSEEREQKIREYLSSM